MATNNQKEVTKESDQKNKSKVPYGFLGIFTLLGLIALMNGIGIYSKAVSKTNSAFHQQIALLFFILASVLWVGSFVIYEIRKVVFFLKESQNNENQSSDKKIV